MTAERPGDSGISQDRILVLPNAVAVLDGASGTADRHRDGGWYADQLVTALRPLLPGDRPLPEILRDAIAAVTRAHDLTPGSSPSSTVAIARWNTDQLDALALGDTAVVTFTTTSDEPDILEDLRLDTIATEQRNAYRANLAAGNGFGPRHHELLRQVVTEERRHRNTPGGYWIAETDPDAANHALTATWPLHHIRAVLIATDGITAGINRYGTPPSWSDAARLVSQMGPDTLISAINQLENADPIGMTWPRSKRCDDKTVAFCETTMALNN